MKVVQLSAGQGPSECCLAVARACELMMSEAAVLGIRLEWLDSEAGAEKSTFRSILLALVDSPQRQPDQTSVRSLDQSRDQLPHQHPDQRLDQVGDFLQCWQGTMQWICPSPYRPFHRRKNWFFNAKIWNLPDLPDHTEAEFQITTCRSSGAGGQHVNTTDSAVQISHRPTGLSVKVQSGRSQHHNRRLAWALIQHKLAQQHESSQALVKGSLRMQHHRLERGRAIRVFEGEAFRERQY